MITIRTRSLFFDSPQILRALDRATRRTLSRFGAFVRTRALSMLLRHVVRSFGKKSRVRNRQGTAPAGTPPYQHLGLMARFLYFSYDPERKSVVVGPMRLNQNTGSTLQALEYGGPSMIYDPVGKVRRSVQIGPRPTMGPAMAAELPGLPAMWQNSVRR